MRLKVASILIGLLISNLSATFAETPSEVVARMPPEKCLALVVSLEPTLAETLAGVKTSMNMLISDRDALQKQLAPIEQVIKEKNEMQFKSYGGLAEAYYFNGEKAKGEAIFDKFYPHAKEVLGATDTYGSGVAGDFAILYFRENNFAKAEPLFQAAIKDFESNNPLAMGNNLMSDYICLTLMKNKQGKKAEAETLARKALELSIKIKENAPPVLQK